MFRFSLSCILVCLWRLGSLLRIGIESDPVFGNTVFGNRGLSPILVPFAGVSAACETGGIP